MAQHTAQLNITIRKLVTDHRMQEIQSIEKLKQLHESFWSAIFKELPQIDPAEEHNVTMLGDSLWVDDEFKLKSGIGAIHRTLKMNRMAIQLRAKCNQGEMWAAVSEQFPELDLTDNDASVKLEWSETDDLVLEKAELLYVDN